MLTKEKEDEVVKFVVQLRLEKKRKKASTEMLGALKAASFILNQLEAGILVFNDDDVNQAARMVRCAIYSATGE